MNPKTYQTPRFVLGAFIQDDTFNRIECWLEQVTELVRLVAPDNAEIEKGGTLTALNLIEEKAGQISEAIKAGYDRYREAPQKFDERKAAT